MKLPSIAFIISTVLGLIVPLHAASASDLTKPVSHPALPTETAPATLDALLNPRGTSARDTSHLRIQMISDAGRTVGFRGGVASRAATIRASLEKRGVELDRLFNFAPLITPSGTLPPVIVEAQDVASFSGQQYRTASKVYRIERSERFVSVPPTWRDYLHTGLPTNPNVGLPTAESQPKNSEETEAWKRSVGAGWNDGIAHANAILRANFSRMARDYSGMLSYSTLLQKGMISQTRVAETQRVVSGNAKELMIGDTTRQLTAQAQLQADANRWVPTVSYAPGYTIKAPVEPILAASSDANHVLAAVMLPAGSELLTSQATNTALQPATPLVVDHSSTLSLATSLASPITQTAMPALVPDSENANGMLAASQPVAAAAPVQQQKTLPAAPTAETLPSPNEPAQDAELPPPPELTWTGRQGQTLRSVITDWAKTATPSWHVDWTTDLDYPIAMDFDVSAVTFLDAVTRIFAPYQKAQRYFSLTQQPKQRVLIVEEEKF